MKALGVLPTWQDLLLLLCVLVALADVAGALGSRLRQQLTRQTTVVLLHLVAAALLSKNTAGPRSTCPLKGTPVPGTLEACHGVPRPPSGLPRTVVYWPWSALMVQSHSQLVEGHKERLRGVPMGMVGFPHLKEGGSVPAGGYIHPATGAPPHCSASRATLRRPPHIPPTPS